MRPLIAVALALLPAICSGPPQQGQTIASVDGAFLADGALRVFQVDPLDSVIVADGFASWGFFDFSDDGKWLAYFRGSSSGRDTIEIVPATGGQPVTVVDATPEAWWSPGPATLAFTRSLSPPGRGELWVVSPGGPPVRITDAFAYDGHCGNSPAFSPDGSRIAYLEDTAGNGELGLVVATPDGARRELVRRPPGYAVRAFLWSPDGTRLAYAVNVPPQLGSIGSDEWWVADAATGSGVSLGKGSAVYWSPDGSRLFHIQNRVEGGSNYDDVHERAGDGTGDRIVATTAEGEKIDWAGWSPTGGSIAFVAGRFIGIPVRDALFTVVPGSPPAALPDVVVGDANRNPLISWSPDAAWLVLVRHDPATGNEALLLESRDGALRLAPAGAASASVRTFGWSSDGRLAYVLSNFPGSSVAPGGRAFAWAPYGSAVEATAQGVNVGDLEWTPHGALVGTGSRHVGGEDYEQPLLAWRAAQGEAVVVAKSVYGFRAARRHPDLFGRCK